MASVVVNGDVSGSVTLQAPSAAGSVTVTLPSTSGTMAVLPTATGVLTEANGGTGTTTGYYGFKNRIINGAMVIDQRNAGASISVAAATPSTYFPVDRFFCQSTGTAFTAQRVTGSGSFKNALRLTGAASNTGAYTTQRIESLNTYDLVSQSVTLSAVLSRSSGTTCTWTAYYANTTDTFSSVTSIATGTFTLTSTATAYSATFNAGANAGNGIMIEFTWGALGAGVTVDITGVQLEKGSTATSFDYRPYGTELALCQRYYESTAFPDASFGINAVRVTVSSSTNAFAGGFNYLVPKRTNSPTVTLYSRNGTSGKTSLVSTGADVAGTSTANNIGGTGFWGVSIGTPPAAGSGIEAGWTASAEL